MVTITIPNWHPAPLNKLMRNRWEAARLKKADREIIAHYASKSPKANSKRRVSLTITLAKGQRACDPDAYTKSLLDGLVHCGQLVDDSRLWCEIEAIKFERGNKSTTILLEAV